MPKRGVIASVLTTFALILLINFKTPSQQGLAPLGAGSRVVVRGQPAQASTAPTVGDQTPAPSDAGGQAASSQGATSRGTGQASTTGSAKHATGTFTGGTVETPFGNVQVQVTLKSGRITNIQPLQLPNDRMRSQMIAQYAEPILRTEALQAQSAQIDLVSGATYTSEGYAQSLQSALDQAQ